MDFSISGWVARSTSARFMAGMRHSECFVDQPPGRLKDLQASVHVAAGTQAIGVLPANQQRRQIVAGRQDHAPCPSVIPGPVVS